MILRNSKYQLPFELPEPRFGDQNTKLIYIMEKIYEKISAKNNYGVPKFSSKGYMGSMSRNGKRNKKTSQILNESMSETDYLKDIDESERRD